MHVSDETATYKGKHVKTQAMGAEMELHRLVDLALRSPDAGVVNFNHLHTLLHAILNHIGLSYDPLSGAIDTQVAAPTKEPNGKSLQSEQSTTENKAVTELDRSNATVKPHECSDDAFTLSAALERDFARLGNLFVYHRFVKLQLFEYANNLWLLRWCRCDTLNFVKTINLAQVESIVN